jgi:hypothetical protein
MTLSPQPTTVYIGWDVGGWNCDKNANSRDAICILDAQCALVGKAWRGNLRQSINAATDAADWLSRLFALCGAFVPTSPYRAILAIDTPLGFSTELVDLLTRQQPVASLGASETNPYLFRHTERFLFEHGIRPLSPIKDMIGSQATKGMHVLAKFAPQTQRCGVWSDGNLLTAIEAYPSPCKRSATMQQLIGRYPAMDHEDKQDALTCALLGYLFDQSPKKLIPPDNAIAINEGWIWVPQDCIEIRTP